MSGMWDTVIVILVPGGPEFGDIVTYGLPSVPRSDAHTTLPNGTITINIKNNIIFLNYEQR